MRSISSWLSTGNICARRASKVGERAGEIMRGPACRVRRAALAGFRRIPDARVPRPFALLPRDKRSVVRKAVRHPLSGFSIAELHRHFVHVAPAPRLARLERADDRMAGGT